MRKKMITGDISLRDIPFLMSSHYVWTVSLYAVQLDGRPKVLMQTTGYTAIQTPWLFAFYLNDDHVAGSIEGYGIQVEVLDKQVVVADVDQRFSIAWQSDAPSVQTLFLQPQAI